MALDKLFHPPVVIEDPGWASLKDAGEGGGVLRSPWGGKSKGATLGEGKETKRLFWNDKLGFRTDVSGNSGLSFPNISLMGTNLPIRDKSAN